MCEGCKMDRGGEVIKEGNLKAKMRDNLMHC